MPKKDKISAVPPQEHEVEKDLNQQRTKEPHNQSNPFKGRVFSPLLLPTKEDSIWVRTEPHSAPLQQRRGRRRPRGRNWRRRTSEMETKGGAGRRRLAVGVIWLGFTDSR